MGDPAGVGPEICLDLLQMPEIAEICVPIVIGSKAVLIACAEKTQKVLPQRFIDRSELGVVAEPTVWDLANIRMADFSAGTATAATGRASYEFIMEAIALAMDGVVSGVVTAPINKEALHAAGVNQPGHTEIFAEQMNAPRFCMMQFSAEITCTFVTVHVGYRDVPACLSIERIAEVIGLTREAMMRIHGREPRIVVCGLNPHAGENGLFGDREEERLIVPAIELARADGALIEGPVPPDTAFLPQRRQKTDAFVCMYHDQGHIPLKALAFDTAVNTTLGLPVIRTSVDHGTALDIAWKGVASSQSLVEATKLAVRLAK